MLEKIKEELYKLHLMLPKEGLVTWTSGNVSARDPESGFVVIKPSGIMYEDLRPEDHVVVNLEGDVIEGKLKPSSDTASHLYIYRERPDVNGIVHTHSPYATAFAALGKPIPVYLTAHGDEFGCPIPCAGFALIGKNAKSAVKAAVMVEDIARTVHFALLMGQPDEIAPADVEKLHYRYMNVYGQK